MLIIKYLYHYLPKYCDNTTLRNLAQSIVASSFTMEDAVNKIAMWVRGNIGYSSTNPQDALTVYNRRAENCRGFTHLAIALLRSVGIPARYVSGVVLPYGYNIPYRSSGYCTIGQDGPGFHAVYEIYYPSLEKWVRGDGQGTVHHTEPNIIKFNHELDEETTGIKRTIGYTGLKPVFDYGTSISSSIGSVTANYQYVTEYAFAGSVAGLLFSSHQDCIGTGINDIIEITSGTGNFKAGEDVFYSSTFTSYEGNTWPVSRYWSIELYHTNGTYLYASQDNPQQVGSSWGIKTNPILPDYKWLLDGNGQIFGEVHVDALLNDGDIVSAKMPLSIEECDGVVVSNQTYTASTTIAGCYVTMDNVTVQNNSNLIVDSEMGVTINGDINVNAGSVFETRASAIVLVPTLAATPAVSGLTCNSATSGGNVTSDGGAAVIERGICWST